MGIINKNLTEFILFSALVVFFKLIPVPIPIIIKVFMRIKPMEAEPKNHTCGPSSM